MRAMLGANRLGLETAQLHLGVFPLTKYLPERNTFCRILCLHVVRKALHNSCAKDYSNQTKLELDGRNSGKVPHLTYGSEPAGEPASSLLGR